jgi:hypothetical protein
MRTRFLWGSLSLALLLLAGACGSKANKPVPMQIQGVNVDISELSAAFVDSPPDLNKQVTQGITKVRYNQYLQGMMELDTALNMPGLSDKQKQVLTKVIGQLKEVVAKPPPP